MVKVDLQKFIEVKITMSLEEARAIRASLSHLSSDDPTDPLFHAMNGAIIRADEMVKEVSE